MKFTKKLLALALVLVFSLSVVCACGNNSETQTTTPVVTTEAPTVETTTEAQVKIVFSVTDKDGNVVDHEITTSEEFLADALIAEGILNAEEKASGFYTTIDGLAASWDENESWWKILKDGEMTEVGMNELTLADGDHYEAVYTIVY